MQYSKYQQKEEEKKKKLIKKEINHGIYIKYIYIIIN